MAEETPTTEQAGKGDEAKASKREGLLKKLLIFGVPVFLVQLVLIYFLTAKFVVPMTLQTHGGNVEVQGGDGKTGDHAEGSDAEENGDAEAAPPHIHVIKDMIINPAGTNGQRYLLTTIAFNISNEEGLKEVEQKEVAVRDLLNSVLTSKTMEQLIDVTQREALREEIHRRAKKLITQGKVKSVYFSKYIVQ